MEGQLAFGYVALNRNRNTSSSLFLWRTFIFLGGTLIFLGGALREGERERVSSVFETNLFQLTVNLREEGLKRLLDLRSFVNGLSSESWPDIMCRSHDTCDLIMCWSCGTWKEGPALAVVLDDEAHRKSRLMRGRERWRVDKKIPNFASHYLHNIVGFHLCLGWRVGENKRLIAFTTRLCSCEGESF